jgi:hypothetical protein
LFTKLWAWLGDNYKSLGGLVALLTLLGLSRPVLAPLLFPPDLTVRYILEPSTVPYDLHSWSTGLSNYLIYNGVPDRLNSFKTSDVTTRLRDFQWPGGIDLFVIELTNESSSDISPVHVSLNDCVALWSAEIDGTYLSAEQAKSFSSKAKLSGSNRVVLPEIPPLPPHSITTIRVYGKFFSTRLDIASSVRSQVIEWVVVESNWRIRNKYLIQAVFSSLVFLIVGLAVAFGIPYLLHKKTVSPPDVPGG